MDRNKFYVVSYYCCHPLGWVLGKSGWGGVPLALHCWWPGRLSVLHCMTVLHSENFPTDTASVSIDGTEPTEVESSVGIQEAENSSPQAGIRPGGFVIVSSSGYSFLRCSKCFRCGGSLRNHCSGPACLRTVLPASYSLVIDFSSMFNSSPTGHAGHTAAQWDSGQIGQQEGK